MAQQKEASQTEKPTPKRLRDARKEGQVHKSQDLSSTLLLAVWMILAFVVAGQVQRNVEGLFVLILNALHQPFDAVLPGVLIATGEVLAWVILPLVCATALMGLLIEFVQVGPVFAPKRARPNMENVSPAEGLKRMFSQKNLVEVFKALFKSVVLAVVGILILRQLLNSFFDLGYGSPEAFIAAYWDGLTLIIFWVIFLFLFISGFDVAYQKQQYIKELMMSRRDIKQEMKDTEGNPEIKQERKGLAKEWSQTSMLDAVLNSNAVVRNPTHYAVAIAYDPEVDDLPTVTAKGSERQAAQIIKLAEEHQIPTLENPPLARGLHAAIDVDDHITEEFFDAVAQVLKWAAEVKAAEEARYKPHLRNQ